MKAKLIIIGAIGLLVALLLVTRAVHQAKSDQLQNPYTGVASVSAVIAKPRPFPRSIEETGVLLGAKEAIISAQTGGQIVKMLVDVGDFVRAGDPIIRIDDELFRLEAARAKNAYDKIKLDFERMQRLHQQSSASDADLEGMRLAMEGAEVGYKMAQKTYDDATVKAPFSGVVSQRFTEVGQMIERSMPVVQIVDNSQLKLILQIPEEQIRFVNLGAPAIVLVDAADDSVVGKVVSVGGKASAGARTFPVEIRLQGGGSLRSGMFARASIDAGFLMDAIVVPGLAVIPDAGRSIVYTAKDNLANRVVVTVLGVNKGETAVTGLVEGDVVITTGNLQVTQGTPLSIRLEGGNAQ